MPDKKYIWGLDLVLGVTGIAIFDMTTLRPVHIGTISTKHIKDDKDRVKRLVYIAKQIYDFYVKYTPRIVCIERNWGNSNFGSTIGLAEVQGCVKAILGSLGTEIVLYAPTSVKKLILRGNATKSLIQQKILKEFPDVNFSPKKDISENESDAFAVALAYMIKNKMIDWTTTL